MACLQIFLAQGLHNACSLQGMLESMPTMPNVLSAISGDRGSQTKSTSDLVAPWLEQTLDDYAMQKPTVGSAHSLPDATDLSRATMRSASSDARAAARIAGAPPPPPSLA